MNVHHAFVRSAALFCAQYKIVPHVTRLGLPRPLNSSAASVRMANKTAPIQLQTTSEVIFGRISNSTIRHVGSPTTFAAATKSALRRVSVCARNTRAPYAQLIRLKTITIVSGPGLSIQRDTT